MAVWLGPLGSVKTLLNGYQGQGHSPRLTFEAVTPFHPGQAYRHWGPLEGLKLCCDTALTSQDLGNSASDSGMPEAVGVGLVLAGAQEAWEVHH